MSVSITWKVEGSDKVHEIPEKAIVEFRNAYGALLRVFFNDQGYFNIRSTEFAPTKSIKFSISEDSSDIAVSSENSITVDTSVDKGHDIILIPVNKEKDKDEQIVRDYCGNQRRFNLKLADKKPCDCEICGELTNKVYEQVEWFRKYEREEWHPISEFIGSKPDKIFGHHKCLVEIRAKRKEKLYCNTSFKDYRKDNQNG